VKREKKERWHRTVIIPTYDQAHDLGESQQTDGKRDEKQQTCNAQDLQTRVTTGNLRVD
jgi:hypothetical protein